MFKPYTINLIFLLLTFAANAQQTVVTGRVVEKGKNEAMPFVSVAFKGTTVGTTTDFEGNFTIKTIKPVDSVIATFMGYKPVIIKIKPEQTQHIVIQMEENVQLMQEAVIRVKVNPALRIVNQAVANRKINDFNLLKSYEYDCYNKTDVSMNNISEKMKNNKLLQPLKQLFDTTNQMKNEDGISILPIFISETQSKYYYNANPSKSKEVLMANNIMGFGIN
ncbi:MAG: carboxypeptidase-like regulatory domain-containing protein, partial [Bacteroidia bacterium]